MTESNQLVLIVAIWVHVWFLFDRDEVFIFAEPEQLVRFSSFQRIIVWAASSKWLSNPISARSIFWHAFYFLLLSPIILFDTFGHNKRPLSSFLRYAIRCLGGTVALFGDRQTVRALHCFEILAWPYWLLFPLYYISLFQFAQVLFREG